MFEEYPVGADLTVMNTYYQYPLKDADGNRLDDFIAVVFKQNWNGEKKHLIIKKPTYTFYMTKANVKMDHNVLFIDKDKVNAITVPYRKLDKEIAIRTGNLDFYNNNIAVRDRAANRKLHAIPTVFASDMSVEDYYRAEFGKRFTNNITKLNKAFFDIEVDGRYAVGDFVELGECPINAIALYDEKHNIIKQYLLHNDKNPLISEYENEIKNGKFTYNDIMKFIENSIGGRKQLIRFGMDKLNISIDFFDSEIELLTSFFKQVHTYDPDFIEGWNSSAFDLAYIIERIKVLGYEPADIMADQSWEIKLVKNYVDEKNISDNEERGDYTFISGNTIWIDQMIQFASIRKSKKGSFKSLKLDDIGELTARVNKLDYSDITNNIVMLPWLNFKIFSLYNIFDVIVQKCIEFKCRDLEHVFGKALMNNTSYKKVHRQTVYLANRFSKEFDKLGYVIGNNTNTWNEKPEKFLGALVNDPMHTNSYAKNKINGIPVMICSNLVDFDYKSLYPSIIIEFNIAPNTQIGRIDIPDKVYDNENVYMNEKYSRGGEFIENLVTDNTIEFCKRWLHLAGFNELLEDIKEFNEKYNTCYNTHNFYEKYGCVDGKVYVSPVRDHHEIKRFTPVRFVKKNDKPVILMNDMKGSGISYVFDR